MKKILFIVSLMATLSVAPVFAGTVKSPDGKVKVTVDEATGVWSVSYKGNVLVDKVQSQMTLASGENAWIAGRSGAVSKAGKVKEHVSTSVYRQAEFDYVYNSLKMDLGTGFSIEWRVSNDGVAYRFSTSRGEETVVTGETMRLDFPTDAECILSCVRNPNRPYKTSFENDYHTVRLSEGSDVPAFLPVSVEAAPGVRVTVVEADHESYPGMFIRPVKGEQALAAEFAPYALKESYIAKTSGARTYPWRILKITTDDTQLPVDNLVYALSKPSRIADESWIKPGFTTWDWWCDWQITDVPFTPGVNTETYKYYIDFAAANGVEYILLDEGWGKIGPGQNLMVPIPAVDLEYLTSYGASKGVRLLLWVMTNKFHPEAEEVCARYEKLGVAGFKCDFLDCNDQQGVEKIYEIAEIAARHHMIIDLHGIFPPAGLDRTYPNLVNFEGVWGLENAKDTHEQQIIPYDVTIPYLRNMYGICDYTPGAMRNFTKSGYTPSKSHPGSPGTRARQVATYVTLDSPLTMLCDTPSNYYKEQETVDFITSLPRTYDSKLCLSGKLGETVVIAREAAGAWYVGGMTDWTPRDIKVSFKFLKKGTWEVKLFRDGENADENAQDYRVETFTVTPSSTADIHLASGGGFCMQIKKIK
ncbi:MAG: glycoside hydrolase family 97 protein [Bacteroidales bacterium]|nr:glycoside hydrolase family 97 protein [Bacteroidales bacterium]